MIKYLNILTTNYSPLYIIICGLGLPDLGGTRQTLAACVVVLHSARYDYCGY